MPPSLRRAFRDIRTATQILAGAKTILDVKFNFSLPVPPKIRGFLTSKLKKGLVQGFTKGLKQAALAAATGGASTYLQFALRAGTIAQTAQSARQVFGMLSGKKNSAISSIEKATTLFGLGASIKNQLDPEKLRLPIKEGPSIEGAQAGKPLKETLAATSLKVLTSVQIAAGVAGKLKAFKDLDSLKRSPRYFDLSKASQPNPPENSLPADLIEAVVTPTSALYSQCGLTADEIMYRIVLLAENVFYPANEEAIRRGYGSLEILEGFRSENSGSSQHERGEAFDFTLPNSQHLYELARWMRDNVVYDQLILCFSQLNGGHSWIHVSFSPEARRRLVMTKTSNDLFWPGLYHMGNYTNAGLKNEDIARGVENEELAKSLVEQLIAKDNKLNPISTNTSELPEGFAGIEEERCLVDPFGIKYVPDNSASGTVQGIVAEMLDDPEWRAVIERENRREAVSFLQEVVSRAHAAGQTNIGINSVRGASNDPSCDAIAIKNPTGTKNFGSWETRIQIMDVVGSANSPDASPAWIDVTSVCSGTKGGGYLNHETLQPEDGAPAAEPPVPPPPGPPGGGAETPPIIPETPVL